ncbi:MAG: glycerate kinase [Candidatus Bathyarchaeia archaeon]|nr:glycerate kinase [Candidatus Bathyarchaeota archaeon]
MIKIKNKNLLIENGLTIEAREARRLVLNGLEETLKLADPNSFLSRWVSRANNILQVGELKFNLNNFKRIFLVGAGKAGGSMAAFIEAILEDKLTEGWVNIPKGYKVPSLRRVNIHESSHPIPDEASVTGALKIINIVEKAEAEDLIICVLSGGASSLMAYPRNGLTLKDKQEITRKLMLAGADIKELNCVRKHLSAIKGGWLAKKAYPATVISLILSDVIGDDLSVIASGPTAPDNSTFKEAIEILMKYDVWSNLSQSIRGFLLDGEKGLIDETPKEGDECFQKTYNFIIGSNRDVCFNLLEFYKRNGLNSIFLTSQLIGEAREAGKFYASILREIESSNNPIKKPCVVILGGETTVTVKGKGIGGRNQESMVSACIEIDGINGAAIASMGTDGIDGVTDAAGAIIDGFTLQRAKQLKLNLKKVLQENDSYNFFKALNDLIFTGPTGTNVNDIVLIVKI